MKRLILIISSAAIGAGAFAAPASAHGTNGCDGHAYGNHTANVWVGDDDNTVVDVGGLYYIDDRNYANGNGLWIYEESNGQTGLQRGGTPPKVPDAGIFVESFEPCQESLNPDTIIW